MYDEIAAWRRNFHQHPELLYETHRTASLVAAKLREFGCDEVAEGLGRTGVVGLIIGRRDTNDRVLGLRANLDALPILEETGLPYASKTPGIMHACGHDGHTAMLLGAAVRSAPVIDPEGGGEARRRSMLKGTKEYITWRSIHCDSTMPAASASR
jgi:hippurate hydrolase